jgi:hypothetical protein
VQTLGRNQVSGRLRASEFRGLEVVDVPLEQHEVGLRLEDDLRERLQLVVGLGAGIGELQHLEAAAVPVQGPLDPVREALLDGQAHGDREGVPDHRDPVDALGLLEIELPLAVAPLVALEVALLPAQAEVALDGRGRRQLPEEPADGVLRSDPGQGRRSEQQQDRDQDAAEHVSGSRIRRADDASSTRQR